MAHGKHTRSPGWKSGDYWVECERCGLDYRQSEMAQEWTGAIVCTTGPEPCWEPRHPSDFVRSVPDDMSPRGLHRSAAQFDRTKLDEVCNPTSVAGKAVAGCMIAGYPDVDTGGEVPIATFGGNGL